MERKGPPAIETCYSTIADIISTKRYKELRKYVHVVDNTTIDKPENGKLFKTNTAIDVVGENSMTMESDPVQSIDEQVISQKQNKEMGIQNICLCKSEWNDVTSFCMQGKTVQIKLIVLQQM